MLNMRDAREVGMGLMDKAVGLVLEAAGTMTGNNRLRDSGRARQDSASERLAAIEEEAKATQREQQARAERGEQERLQDRQRGGGRGRGGRDRGDRREASAGGALSEKVKGVAKEAAGSVTGKETLEREGEVQQKRAQTKGEAQKHELRAKEHRERARAGQEESEELRNAAR